MERYEPLQVSADERRQIEQQLTLAFGLTPEGARAWVDTTLQRGRYFGRKDGERVAASFALEPIDFRRGGDTLPALMLQSHYVHPKYRGLGYGIARRDLDAVLRRFSAAAVVLSLYDEGLIPYWERLGFALEQVAETIDLTTYLERATRLRFPVFTREYVEEKVLEASADGARVTRENGMVLVRARGAETVTELLVTDFERAGAATGIYAGLRVQLRAVMSYPGPFGLFCPVDV